MMKVDVVVVVVIVTLVLCYYYHYCLAEEENCRFAFVKDQKQDEMMTMVVVEVSIEQLILKDFPFRIGPTRMIRGPTRLPFAIRARQSSSPVSLPPTSRTSVMPKAIKRGRADSVVQLK